MLYRDDQENKATRLQVHDYLQSLKQNNNSAINKLMKDIVKNH